MVAVQSHVFAVGGYAPPRTPAYTGAVEAYESRTDSWASKNSAPTVRFGMARATTGSTICLVGGSALPQADILEQYSIMTDVWASMNAAPTASYDAGLAAVGDELFFVRGGC